MHMFFPSKSIIVLEIFKYVVVTCSGKFIPNLESPELASRMMFLSRHIWEAGFFALLLGHSRNSKNPMWLAVSSTRTLIT